MRTILTGANLVLADRVVSGHVLIISGDRIADVVASAFRPGAGDSIIELTEHTIVPGFVDVHVHGVNGRDTLDGHGAIRAMSADLPRWGVTAFCPTTVACSPERLNVVLDEVGELRRTPVPNGARVLPAHLESNFINPAYRGAQPAAALRPPRADPHARPHTSDFTGGDVLAVIRRHARNIGIVTMAPELDGGIDLVRELIALGIRVSLGHTDATLDIARAAIAAGASHATHLFNRMRPMTHHDPGVIGAVLTDDRVTAELICDGHHVDPTMMRVAIAAKRRIIAITDGTAGSGQPVGSKFTLGGQPITVSEIARLDDGTMAGSVLTMDRAFRVLVSELGLSLPEAARMCATTAAHEMGLVDSGVIARNAIADLVVLTRRMDVAQTWIAGRMVYRAPAATPSDADSSVRS